MAAYFIVSISIPVTDSGAKNRGDYDEYIARVKPIVENHGGEYIIRSEKIAHLAGEWKPDRLIVIRFPSPEKLEKCFASPEYKRIETMRTHSVHSSVILVEE